MKKCNRCGMTWTGYGAQPRQREVCEGCGAYLHCCLSCRHFDHRRTRACKLKTTVYIGSRTALNYCEEYQIEDTRLQVAEDRVDRARDAWESLFQN